MKKTSLILLIAVVAIGATGCGGIGPPVDRVEKHGNLDVMEDKVKEIVSDAEVVAGEFPESQEAPKIVANAGDVLDRVGAAKASATASDKEYAKLHKDFLKEQKAKESAIKAKNSAIQRMLKFIVGGCIIGLGVFGILFFMYGSKLGMIGAPMCGAVLVVALFVQAYMAWLLIAGAIVFCGLVGLFIYLTAIKGLAFREVVAGVQRVKMSAWDKADTSELGRANVKVITNDLAIEQSGSTKKIISNMLDKT